MIRVGLLLIIPPILLAIITTIVATYIGMKTHGSREAIGKGITNSLPYILMVNHALLFLLLLAFLRLDEISLGAIGWQLPSGKASLWMEIIIGIGAGIIVGLFAWFVLEPLLFKIAQHTIGGYQLDSEFEGSVIAWLIGLIVFAPIVEESIYRGYAIHGLSLHMGTVWAMVVSSVLFGPLHWGEGLWGIVNAIILGFFFAGVFIWRENLIAPAVAHAVINIILFSGAFIKTKKVGDNNAETTNNGEFITTD